MATTKPYWAFFRLRHEPFRGKMAAARLEQADLGKYIFNQLRDVGGPRRELFRETAVRAVYCYTGGRPDAVATICRQALARAASEKSLVVGVNAVTQAADELGWAPIKPLASDVWADATLPGNGGEKERKGVLAGVRGAALAATMLTLIGVVVGFGAGSLLEGRGDIDPAPEANADDERFSLEMSASLSSAPPPQADEAPERRAFGLSAVLDALLSPPEAQEEETPPEREQF